MDYLFTYLPGKGRSGDESPGPAALVALFVALFLLPLNVFATNGDRSGHSLDITVSDTAGNPIAGAVLFVDDQHDTEAVSDANGSVQYELGDGKYVIYSYAADYLDRVVPVTIAGGDLQVDIVHRDALSWSTAPANAPIGIGEANGVRLAAAGGKVYLHAAFGGVPGTTDYGALFDFFAYDPQTDAWTRLPDAPYGGLYGITTAYGPTPEGGDAIYIMRGFPGGQRTWMARYDIDAGTWEEGLNHEIPWREDLGNQYGGTGFQDYPRNGAVLVWDNGDHMYLFPGSAYSYEKYDWYRYSVSNDSWEAMDALPHRQGPGNAAVFVPGDAAGLDQDYVFVQFGLTPVGDYTAAEFWRYGLSSGEWQRMSSHAYGADDGSMLAWDGNDHIYHTPGAYVEQLWDRGLDQKRELMRYSISEERWTQMEPGPYNQWGGWDDAGGIVRVDRTLFGMKGGSDVAWAEDGFVSGGGDIPSNKVWKFDIPDRPHDLVMAEPAGEGRTYPAPATYSYPEGAVIDLQAIPQQGWTFVEWRANDNHFGDEAATSVTIGDRVVIEAVFEPEDFLLYAFPDHLFNLNYVHGQGPSAAQSFNLTGRNLDPGAGDILVEGSDHFEVSADGQSFGQSASIAYVDGTLETTPVYVRLAAGLPIGNYAGERIAISGGGASIHVTASGEVSSTGLPYAQDFGGFVSNESLPEGWSLDDTYTYRGTFGENNGGGLYGNGTLGFQVTATQPNNDFTATLSLENNTGRTVSNLLVKYLGRTARNVPGTPSWTVSVNGAEQPSLGYSTAPDEDREVLAVLGGLSIGDEDAIEISWFTTSEGTSGHRRQIGVTGVVVDEIYPVYGADDIAVVPDRTSIAVRGPVELYGALTINHLVIEEGHSLHVMPGAKLTVKGNVYNQRAEDDAAGGLVVRADATGTGSLILHREHVAAVAERHITPREGDWGDPDNNTGWHLVSSPVDDQEIAGDWTPGNDGGQYAFFAWSEEGQEWLDQKVEEHGIDSFIPGKGYLVAYSTEQTNTFTGMVQAADVEDLRVTKSGTEEGFGWNLMGNPFPSAIRWNDDSWSLGPDMGGIAKTWDERRQSYADMLAGELIPAMNGFFVYYGPDEKDSGTLTIPAGARTHDDASTQKNDADHMLRLMVSDAGHKASQEVILRFIPEATAGFDLDWDAYFLAGHAPHLFFDAGGKHLSTHSLPEWSEDLVIPLGFKKNADDAFVLELTMAMADTPVYLFDTREETEHRLRKDAPYAFDAGDDDPTDRFELRFKEDVPEPPREEGVLVYAYENKLYIVFDEEKEGAYLEMFDLQGRRMLHTALDAAREHTLTLSYLQGLYVVRIQTPGASYTEKILLYGH